MITRVKVSARTAFFVPAAALIRGRRLTEGGAYSSTYVMKAMDDFLIRE